MRSNQKNTNLTPVKPLDQNLIDKLYKELTKELDELIKEINDSSKIGAFGAMATLSNRVSEIASDLKKLQRLPTMIRNPFLMADPRQLLDEIEKKYSKKKKKRL